MPVIGITGGVACGKSTVFGILTEHLAAVGVSTDKLAAQLLAEDPATQQRVIEELGKEVLALDGTIDKARLRRLIFADDVARKQLEAILHPRVRAKWLQESEPYSTPGSRFFLVEIPLLFENKLAEHFCKIVAVGCSKSVQIRRLAEQRKLSRAEALAIIGAQLPLMEKLDQSDYIVWNDGEFSVLSHQTTLLARGLAGYEQAR